MTPLLRERVAGLLLPLVLFIAALFGSVGVILPAAVLLLATRGHFLPVYRWIVDSCSFAWFTLSSALLEWLARVRVVVRGDGATRPTDERVSIIICNHNSRLDWMFLWCLMARHRSCGRLKIALQEPLKAAGPFGWAMQAFLFIFLSRKDREADLQRLRAICAHASRHGPMSVLLFPEGTDFSDNALAKSDAYADAKGLPRYTRLLHPKTAGFVACVQSLGERLDAVYDATVAYTPHPLAAAAADPRPWEYDFPRGTLPRSVLLLLDVPDPNPTLTLTLTQP